ncbi:hypothetical protein [Vibrio mediterranei]|uniref:hypothetical protein n=1 Tax=Vibrio mediterranei TaxID=689 RepID=UPI004067B102
MLVVDENLPNNQFTSETMCGAPLRMRFFGSNTIVDRITIGTLFTPMITVYPQSSERPEETILFVMRFFEIYAPTLSEAELVKGWETYRHHSDTTFWDFFGI